MPRRSPLAIFADLLSTACNYPIGDLGDLAADAGPGDDNPDRTREAPLETCRDGLKTGGETEVGGGGDDVCQAAGCEDGWKNATRPRSTAAARAPAVRTIRAAPWMPTVTAGRANAGSVSAHL